MNQLYDERESGFTLIEILVSVVIFGIVSTIAIGAFLNQRSKNIDKEMESEIKAMAMDVTDLTLKTDLLDTGGKIKLMTPAGKNITGYTSGKPFVIDVDGLKTKEFVLGNPNTKISLKDVGSGNHFVVLAYNPKANKYKSTSTAYKYDSEKIEDANVSGN